MGITGCSSDKEEWQCPQGSTTIQNIAVPQAIVTLMDYPETPLEPTATEPEPTEDPAHAFHVSQFNVLYVTCQKVRRETQRDPTLVKVYERLE